MTVEHVGPGGVSNSYGVRTTTSKVVYENDNTYQDVFIPTGSVPVTATPSAQGLVFNQQEAVIPDAIKSKLSALGLDIRVMYGNAPGAVRTTGWLEWAAGGVVTPEAYFDKFSSARSAPVNTYYVATTGNDSTGNGSQATPYRTINKAMQVGNAAAAPYKVFVAAGTYNRTQSFTSNVGTKPNQDCAFVATGGRVVVGSWDDFTAPSADDTYANCYSYAVTLVDRVLDLLRLDRFGRYAELRNVPSAARCNVTPDSWAFVGGTLYINRGDGAAVTNANTRVLRQNFVLSLDGTVSVFLGGATESDGFDLMGGQAFGLLDSQTTTPSATPKTVVASNCSFRFAGGLQGASARCVNLESHHGCHAFFRCSADAGATDGFNLHNTYSAATTGLITVGCVGIDNGRAASTSCNGWTNHENSWGIDVAGYYEANRGGSVRSVNAALALFAGTCVRYDQGDIIKGGSIPPTAFRADNTVQYWLDGVRVEGLTGSFAAVAYDSTSVISYRNCQFSGLALGGAGSVSAY